MGDNSEFILTTHLRAGDGDFVATEAKTIRIGDLLVLNIKEQEYIRRVNRDYQISLPQISYSNKNPGDAVALCVKMIVSQKTGSHRPRFSYTNKAIDIGAFVPSQTHFSSPVFIIPRDNQKITIWYPARGCAQPITLNRYAQPNDLGELMGFYYGDGSTGCGIRSFRLTNEEPSILKHCLKICCSLGLQIGQFKAQIICSTPDTLEEDKKKECVDHWCSHLQLHDHQIVSVTKSQSKYETKGFGSLRLIIDNATLTEVMLGVLQGTLKRVLNPTRKEDIELLKGFVRGLLAAEGSVMRNHHNSLIGISISYDPHSEELLVYQRLLSNLGIKCCGVHSNQLIVRKFENMKKFYSLRGFGLHARRNQLFMEGLCAHRYFRALDLE
ncbi:LAGLIDADG family homing endonuclease [Candidatus Woesearchaeota archaeon]|nr:LAGLIDADG family homing endonuclease [Candidatus Woesearchaeota archaeon]